MFISGLNYANNTTKDADPDGLYYAVLNYCKENPLKNIADAAEHVYYKKL